MAGYLQETASKGTVDGVDSLYRNIQSENSCRQTVDINTGDKVN